MWQVVTEAHGQPEDKESMLHIPVEWRSRIQPSLPLGYLGNARYHKINSWARFHIYDVDFGWGKPLYVGFCGILRKGITVVHPSPIKYGGLLYTIFLPKEQMQVFEKLLYQS